MQEIKLGQMIRERMEARNMSLAEFARAIGRSSSTALEIFDKDSIKLEQIEEISKALDFNFLQVRADRLAHSIGKNQYLQETDEYSNIKFTYDEYGIRHADRIQLNKLIDCYRQQKTAFAKPLLLLEVGYTFGAREVVEKVYTSVFDGPQHETYSPETLEQLNRDIVLIDYRDVNTHGTKINDENHFKSVLANYPKSHKHTVCIARFDNKYHFRKMFNTWGEAFFVVAYDWNRKSLYSWARGERMSQEVTSFIKDNIIDEDTLRNYCMPSDYPTTIRCTEEEWRLVDTYFYDSRTIRETRERSKDLYHKGLISEIESFLDKKE